MSDLSFKLMHRTRINGPPVANLDNSCNDIRSRNAFSSFGCTKHIFWLWKRICIWKKPWIIFYESSWWLTRNTATTDCIRFIVMSDKINFMFVEKFFRITPWCTWKDHINISTVSQSFISFFICTNCSSWIFFLNFPKISHEIHQENSPNPLWISRSGTYDHATGSYKWSPFYF